MFTEDEIWYGGGALGALPDTRVVPKKFEAPPAYGTKRNPLAAALSQGMADAERRRAQEGREEIRSGLSTLDKAKGVLEGTAMLGTACLALARELNSPQRQPARRASRSWTRGKTFCGLPVPTSQLHP
jgi:hypothetical protein